MLFLNTQCHFLCFMFWGNIQLGLAFHSLKLTLFFYFPPPRFVQGRQEIRQPKFKVPFFDGTVYIWQMAADHQARSKTMTIDANVSTHRVSQLR